MKIKDMAYVALMSGIMAICSWITIPFTVPITMQTFGVFCTLLLLGGKLGTLSIIIFIGLGALGVPVFSGGGAGIGYLTGPTGGFIVGFLAIGLIYMLFEKLIHAYTKIKYPILLFGLGACYAIGTIWYALVSGVEKGKGVGWIIGVCVLPFIIPDVAKLCLAGYVSNRLNKVIDKTKKQ